MIDFYTWTTPNGRKVSILLEELGVEYNVHSINIGQGEQFEESFLAISPNNKIPAIHDHEWLEFYCWGLSQGNFPQTARPGQY